MGTYFALGLASLQKPLAVGLGWSRSWHSCMDLDHSSPTMTVCHWYGSIVLVWNNSEIHLRHCGNVSILAPFSRGNKGFSLAISFEERRGAGWWSGWCWFCLSRCYCKGYFSQKPSNSSANCSLSFQSSFFGLVSDDKVSPQNVSTSLFSAAYMSPS